MQLTTVILLVFSLSLSARSISQTVNFTGREVPAELVFDEIRAQTGLSVLIKKDALRDIGKVSIEVKDMDISEFLGLLLKNKPYGFEIEANTIFIRKKTADDVNHRLPFPLLSTPPITIRGRIVNEKGEPVVASITVKGTKKGVTTNSYGSFELAGVDENSVLIVSGINIETQEIKINGRSEINITATTKFAAEEEVVFNAGYWNVKDKERTGSISKVTAKDIERQPITNPLMALQGRVPGVEISPVTGVPGSAPKIQVRGQNSIRVDGGFPLYVIDGIPVDSRPITSGNIGILGEGFDPLSTINSANIESIEILKDADATAIYGSRGANGVIIVTTKRKAQKKDINIDMSFYKGWGNVKKMEMLNAAEYLEMRHELFRNDNVTTPAFYDYDLNGEWDTTRETDWQDVLYGNTGQITNAQLNLSGGNQYTSFRIGGNYHKETMVFPGDFGYERFTGNFSLNHKSKNEKFSLNTTANYGSDKKDLISGSLFMEAARILPPVAPALFTTDGKLNWQNSTWNNPFAELLKTHQAETDNIFFNTTAEYKVIHQLTAKLSVGYTDLNSREILKEPVAAYNPAFVTSDVKGAGSFGTTKRKSWIIEPQLSFQQKLGQGSLNILAGMTFQQSTSYNQQLRAEGYSSDALLGSLRGATKITAVNDMYALYAYESFFGRVAYNLKEKYFLNLTGRVDGSSRFGPSNRYAGFGSIGAAWIFTNEKWFNNSSFLSFGKLRGSYGTTGNDQIGDYRFYNTYGITQNTYQGLSNLAPTSLFNPDYQWEVTKKFEAAIQLGIFKDKLNIELAWYRNRSSNQLIDYSLPSTTGFESILYNLGAIIENEGFELGITSTNISNKNFRWSTSFNITIPRNKLVAFPGIETSSYAAQYIIGKSLSIQKFYQFLGVNPATGFYEFLDNNKDETIDDLDRVAELDLDRKYYGGINNSFTFRNVEFSFLFQFSKQNVVRGFSNWGSPGERSNQMSQVLDRWQKPGDLAAFQQFSNMGFLPYYYFLSSDAQIQEVNFIRLKTLSVSYSLPSSFVNKLKTQKINVFIQGQNLLTVTNFKGLDPETGFSLPPLRILSVGIQANF